MNGLQNELLNLQQEAKTAMLVAVDNSVEGVIAVDLDEKIITMNSAAKKILNTNIPISSEADTNLIENALFNFQQKEN